MLDHIVYAVPDLAQAVADLQERLGVRATLGGKHTGRGTHNALLSLSAESYMEVIGPDPDQPPPAMPRPFGIDALTEPRLITWLAKATDLNGIPLCTRQRLQRVAARWWNCTARIHGRKRSGPFWRRWDSRSILAREPHRRLSRRWTPRRVV